MTHGHSQLQSLGIGWESWIIATKRGHRQPQIPRVTAKQNKKPYKADQGRGESESVSERLVDLGNSLPLNERKRTSGHWHCDHRHGMGTEKGEEGKEGGREKLCMAQRERQHNSAQCCARTAVSHRVK